MTSRSCTDLTDGANGRVSRDGFSNQHSAMSGTVRHGRVARGDSMNDDGENCRRGGERRGGAGVVVIRNGGLN